MSKVRNTIILCNQYTQHNLLVYGIYVIPFFCKEEGNCISARSVVGLSSQKDYPLKKLLRRMSANLGPFITLLQTRKDILMDSHLIYSIDALSLSSSPAGCPLHNVPHDSRRPGLGLPTLVINLLSAVTALAAGGRNVRID